MLCAIRHLTIDDLEKHMGSQTCKECIIRIINIRRNLIPSLIPRQPRNEIKGY